MAEDTKPLERFSVHVATPAYDGKVDEGFASSMLMAGQIATTNFVEVSCSIMGNGAFIELARNVLVHRFLEMEDHKHFTHFMFIDADLKFEPRSLAGLVRANWPVCCGVYRKRQEKEEYPVRWIPEPGSEDRLWMTDEWLHCDRVATGFLCIRRDVLEEMTRRAIAGEFPYDKRPGVVHLHSEGDIPWLFHTKIDDEGRFEGEDFCWCDDYMALHEAGVWDTPIMAWPDFDFTHGGYECNYYKYLEKKVAEGKAVKKLGK